METNRVESCLPLNVKITVAISPLPIKRRVTIQGSIAIRNPCLLDFEQGYPLAHANLIEASWSRPTIGWGRRSIADARRTRLHPDRGERRRGCRPDHCASSLRAARLISATPAKTSVSSPPLHREAVARYGSGLRQLDPTLSGLPEHLAPPAGRPGF